MKVLIIIDHYLPSYKAGGPLRSVPNLIETLDDIEFKIITKDRDLGEKKPLKNIIVDKWTKISGTDIIYLSHRRFTLLGLLKTMKQTDFDTLYLNSFFSPKASIYPLILKYFGFFSKKKIVLAPRGELAPGALKIKRIKKSIYILLSKIIKLHNNIFFHSTSEIETESIRKQFPCLSKNITLIKNPVKLQFEKPFKPKFADSLRLIFLSRIVEKKNLIFILKVLKEIKIKISLDIYGNIEDKIYWNKCNALISQLPSNIKVNYLKALPIHEVVSTFGKYDLFVFPTLGENFGHVVFESLSAGTPVLMSNTTPWKSSSKYKFLTCISLDNKKIWQEEILKQANLIMEKRNLLRIKAFEYVKEYSLKSFNKDNMVKLLK